VEDGHGGVSYLMGWVVFRVQCRDPGREGRG
jgi:hypothetical protein